MELLAAILILLAVNGAVSSSLGASVRSTGLGIITSAIITELLIAIYILSMAAQSRDAADGILAVNIFAIICTAPMFGTLAGFVLLWRHFKRRRARS
jgi:hypothetical protein